MTQVNQFIHHSMPILYYIQESDRKKSGNEANESGGIPTYPSQDLVSRVWSR